MIYQVGITGGIGSGKSTVANIFRTLGYLVYEADSRARSLSNHDPIVIEAIKDTFGADLYLENGELDRKKMAGIVFHDPEKLALLNQIIHPATYRDYDKWFAEIPQDYPHSFILKEAAILFESGSWKKSDGIITVFAPKALRIERVMDRDGTTAEEVSARMENQWPDQKKIDLADFTIFNDGQHAVIPQVLEAIRYFEDQFKKKG